MKSTSHRHHRSAGHESFATLGERFGERRHRGNSLVDNRSSHDPDSKIIAVARQFDYVLLTQDLDFGSLLAATKWHKPSVVQLRTEELSPEVIGKRVCQVFKQLRSELEEGALITFDPRRTRIRILPLL